MQFKIMNRKRTKTLPKRKKHEGIVKCLKQGPEEDICYQYEIC